jgi:hypothetical protein
MSITATILAFLEILPELWRWFQSYQSEQREVAFLEYLQRAKATYERLSKAKGKEELINVAIEIQRLMHGD